MPNIGKYEIESRIGHGGMGDVYRAYDPTLRRRVAVKVLKVGGDSETLSRFRLEATSAGNLNHPNIVTIHDYGDFEGEPYLVMEYLEGQDLQRTIESGRKFDLVEIADIMSQVADALECAHQAGVIHRDVKPANIMLLARGGVKLMDFGIARLAGANTQQTKIGHIVGTVLYMSPEQFRNLELDRRVDIWAFGVIYYQLLAGQHPFQVPDQIVTMYNIANKQVPPICSVNQEVPEALGQIIDRCLAKDRDQRYSGMEDLRLDAMPVLQDLTRQQAARMLTEARSLLEQNYLEGAQAIVKRVLELDPADRSAHALRKTIADGLKKRETGPRVEGLSAAAEQHIAAKEYRQAIELLETALKLDPTAAALKKRVDEVREWMERDRLAAELLKSAATQFESGGDLSTALNAVTEAMRYSPGHSEGSRLLVAIEEEMARRETQRQLREGLENGRNLLRAGSFGDAVDSLKELVANHPGTLEAAQLLRQAEAARAEDLRCRRLRSELGVVKNLLREHKYSEAIQKLEALGAEFPGEEEVRKLVLFAREEWKVWQRTEALERLKAQVAKLQTEGRFEEAVRSVERAQVEFPGETDLPRILQAVVANQAEAERRAAIERTLQDARRKQSSGELTEALRIADLGLETHGPDEKLLALREQLDRDWQAAQRKTALQRSLDEGGVFVRASEWEKAIAHFQQLVRQYPEESEPKKLLAQSQSALADAKERLEREAEEKRKTHERQLKLDEARRKAEAEQARREEEARKAAEEQIRKQTAKVEECLSNAYLAIAQGDLNKAAKLVAEARKTDQNHPRLAQAETDLAAAKTRVTKSPAAPTETPAKAITPAKGIAIGAVAGIAVLAIAFALLQKSPAPLPEPVKAPVAVSKPPAPKVEPPPTPVAESTPTPPPATTTPSETAKPELKLSAEYLNFTAESGAPDPPAKVFYISGTVPAAARYQATVRDSRWAFVTPAAGKIPAQLSAAVHAGQLPPGIYTTQVVFSAEGLQKAANIRLTLTEAAKATPPPPPPEEKKSVSTGIFLGGRRFGDLTWSGSLPPGVSVVIGPGGAIIKGDGRVVNDPFPRDRPFEVSNVPRGVQASVGPNSLTLANVSGAPIDSITVHWAVKQ